MKLKVVWVSTKQKDSRYSALAVSETEPIPGIIQKESAFIRGKKKFVMGQEIAIPEGMSCVVDGDEWKFEALVYGGHVLDVSE